MATLTTRHSWAAGRKVALAAVATGVVLWLVLVCLPLVHGLALGRFTVDDAYITFRYSHNWASGHGPTWNIGAARIDGYTSFLWTALLALADWIGVGLTAASKVMAGACAIATMALLGLYGRRRTPLLRVVAVAALALSPAFAVIVTQGMETALAALLATSAAALFLESVRRRTRPAFAAFWLIALLAVLTRPDMVPFAGVLGVGQLVLLAGGRDWESLRRAAAMFAAAFAVPGIAFLAWRWSYYGNALPNTYYAKKSHGTIDAAGVRMVGDFILNMALPYLLLLAAIGVPTAMRAWRARLERPQLIAIGFVVAAALSFLCVGFTFAPVQGYLFRFQMPALPVLLLALVVTAELDGSPAWPMRRAAAVAAIALALVLVLFPLHTLATARRAVELRWQDDRVNMGRALAPLRSYGLTMFATESGALPYYSGWQAFDDLGLNDRFVAMHGLSIAYMRQRDPALVMLRFSTTGTGVTGDFATIVGFLRSGPYRLGAAVYKTDERLRPVPSGIVHLYFVKQSGLHAAALTHALRAARGVRPLEPAIAAATLRRLGLPGR